MKAAQLTAKTGDIVGGCILQDGDQGDLICISKQGQAIRMSLADIPSRGRATQGVIVMRMDSGDKVASMSVIMLDPAAEAAAAEAAEEDQQSIEELPEEILETPAKKKKKKA